LIITGTIVKKIEHRHQADHSRVLQARIFSVHQC
jgi:hypothetical protein